MLFADEHHLPPMHTCTCAAPPATYAYVSTTCHLCIRAQMSTTYDLIRERLAFHFMMPTTIVVLEYNETPAIPPPLQVRTQGLV